MLPQRRLIHLPELIPTITTARLCLRAFTLDDVDALSRIMGVPEVLRYFPVTTPPTRDQAESFIRRQLDHWHEHGLGWWAIDAVHGDGMIGWAGLQHLPETNETEVAYLIAREHWGQGLAVEAALAGLRFGFETLGKDPIIAVVHVDNIRSYRVLDKLGMTRDRRDRYFGIEVYHYTMYKATYQSLHGPPSAGIVTDCTP